MAFHPLPQIIPAFFNRHEFGPPASVTLLSSCPWLDHRVSGLILLTCRPIQTRFPFASAYRLKLASKTNSQTHYTKGTPSPLRAPTACRHPVSGAISLPSSGCFSPFPHGTMFAIGHVRVFRLGGWSPHVQTGFLVSRPTQGFSSALPVRGCHPLRPTFPDGSSCPC